jgi:hypothetical protein
MKPGVAIARLEKLCAEATDSPLTTAHRMASWRARVGDVLNQAFPPGHPQRGILDAFQSRHSMIMAQTLANGRDPDVRGLVEIAERAIYELSLLNDDYEADVPPDVDPELWEHVEDLVYAEDWGKVASQTAIFVEHRVRTWAGHPRKESTGEELFGKDLWARVLAEDSQYKLGQRKGESEGWRFLGMGFAQALSNVDRHRLQKRDDAQRYAVGVLHLGSLLLTQLRYEHQHTLHDE